MSYPIEQHPSPNHSPRNGTAIRMLVLHATVGSYAASLAWLCNPASDASTHYLIRTDGHITQLVPNELAAWHAGRSRWHGVTDINACSLGIELENANTGHDPYPPAQLRSAHWLGQALISRYNIERGDVVRHLDIATPKGRTSDPAGLPWPAFADSLYMDAPPIDRHYRVKAAVTAGATIRAGAAKNAPVLGRLHAGQDWYGLPEDGQRITIAGFGTSDQWICDGSMRCVWAGLLEEVR